MQDKLKCYKFIFKLFVNITKCKGGFKIDCNPVIMLDKVR